MNPRAVGRRVRNGDTGKKYRVRRGKHVSGKAGFKKGGKACYVGKHSG